MRQLILLKKFKRWVGRDQKWVTLIPISSLFPGSSYWGIYIDKFCEGTPPLEPIFFTFMQFSEKIIPE